MKYSISFYCYKMEKNELLISISKKDGVYLLTETYNTYSLEMPYFMDYTKEVTSICYIPILHYLMDTFSEFYKENITYMPYSFEKMPPDYYITDICDLSIDDYVDMVNRAKIKMENALLLYDEIQKNIKSSLEKAMFRLLTIKIENEKIESLRTLCITADIIVQYL